MRRDARPWQGHQLLCTWHGAPEKLLALLGICEAGQHPALPLSPAPPTAGLWLCRAGAGLGFKIKGQINQGFLTLSGV